MNIFKLLTYNIKEHNYILYSSFKPDNNAPSFWKTLFDEICHTFGRRGLKYLFNQLWHPYYKQVKPLNDVVFTPLSSNNRRALEPIWSHLEHEEFSVLWEEDEIYIPKRFVRIWSFIYILPLLWLYVRSSREDKLRIRTYFEEFFHTMGYIVTLNKLLRYNPVKLIIMANDHCSYTRALIYVATGLDIKTLYTQHCSVTDNFPALPFTYSMLDGEESMEKYLSVGHPNGQIYLMGNPRFDIISQYRISRKTSHKIGIASNALDSESKIKQLCIQLQALGFNDITIRPHPGLPFDPTWYMARGIEFSDSNKENPFAFLSQMNCIIAGECGIHFDAAMMGVQSICYNMTDKTTEIVDWYSYIKNGLIPYTADFDKLVEWLKDAKLNALDKLKIQWYNSAYKTKHEGHIGEMLADFIRYEQAGDVDGFDKKYGFVERTIKGVKCKVYK